MADYSKTTDFAAKDALLTGNPAKIVKGTEIDTEFNNIAIAIASKVDETGGVLTTPQINDTSADHQYVFAVNELGADRTVTLPLLTGNDEFVFKDHAVTLTNKTVSLGSNTVSGTKAQFDTACSDGNFLYVGDVTADVVGPASSTDNAVARFDSTTGKLLQNSAFVVDDSGYVTSFGGQIKFPASQAASADANTLDDYEEGTFTPAGALATPGSSSNSGGNAGVYVKVGGVVHITALVSFTKGTGTGDFSITGLPFANGSGYIAPCSVNTDSVGKASNIVYANVNNGGTAAIFVLQPQSTSGAATLTATDLGATAVFRFQVTYKV